MGERNYRFLNPDIKAAATRLEKVMKHWKNGALMLNPAAFGSLRSGGK
jgi:hypothetical protein